MNREWSETQLDDISEINYGFTAKASFEIDGPKFLRITDIQNGRVDWNTVPSCPITESEYQKHKLYQHDIVFARTGATTGKSFLIKKNPPNSVAASYLIRLRLNDQNVLPEFVSLFFQTPDYWDMVNAGTSGSAQGGFNASKLSNLTLPLPSIEEQKRIVAILDQAFASIDKARANAEQNLKNARELFESSLQKIFKLRGESWKRISLLELLDRKWITSHLDGNHGGDYPRKSEFVESGVPYISAKCLINGKIDMSRAKYLTKERADSLRKGIAKNEDVLFAHNATVGPVTILKTAEEKVILGTSLTYYRCNKKFILPEYFAQYMISYEFTSQYTSIMRQSTRNQVPITKQREFIHVIPPIEEQADIAKSLVELSSQLNQLESIYQQKLDALNELKKSLLKKAFSGELTSKKNREAA